MTLRALPGNIAVSGYELKVLYAALPGAASGVPLPKWHDGTDSISPEGWRTWMLGK